MCRPGCPAQSSWHLYQEELSLGENSWRKVVVLGHAGSSWQFWGCQTSRKEQLLFPKDGTKSRFPPCLYVGIW